VRSEPAQREGCEVCVVTFNSEDVVGALIASLVAEPAVVTIRVFDNASSDSTVRTAGELAADSSVPILVYALGGEPRFPAGCNRLLHEVEADVAAFVNPDVELRDGALSELADPGAIRSLDRNCDVRPADTRRPPRSRSRHGRRRA